MPVAAAWGAARRRDRRRPPARRPARPDAEAAGGGRGLGRRARRRAAAHRQPAPARPAAGLRPAGLRHGRLVGAGRRRRPAGPPARRPRRPARRSTSAPPPAARPCSSPPPAPRSPPSTSPSRRLAPAAREPRPHRPRAEIVVADALAWTPPRRFDAVLVDAPCTATGTIRRHPDLPHLRAGRDLAPLVALQAALLARAWDWLAPGGRLVYCVCSLLPAEGEAQLARFRSAAPTRARCKPDPAALGIAPDWIDAGAASGSAPTTGPSAAAWTASTPPALPSRPRRACPRPV